jgi:hypothetical protein
MMLFAVSHYGVGMVDSTLIRSLVAGSAMIVFLILALAIATRLIQVKFPTKKEKKVLQPNLGEAS